MTMCGNHVTLCNHLVIMSDQLRTMCGHHLTVCDNFLTMCDHLRTMGDN